MIYIYYIGIVDLFFNAYGINIIYDVFALLLYYNLWKKVIISNVS